MNIKLILAFVVAGLVVAQRTCCSDSTVTVSGNGRASGVPDIATLTITISETGSTSKQASSAANVKSSQVLQILSDNDIAPKDIKTTQLAVSPKYDWSQGVRTLRSQEASQTLSVKLRSINADGAAIGSLIDALVLIDNIRVSGIRFDINDKSLLQQQARQSAFGEAKTKAQQYAQLSGLRLGDAITISDSSSSQAQPVFYSAAGSSSASVSVGRV